MRWLDAILPRDTARARLMRIETKVNLILANDDANLEIFMAALDDAKFSLAALISEATTAVDALAARIGAQPNRDPELVQMAADANAAIDRIKAAVAAVPPA